MLFPLSSPMPRVGLVRVSFRRFSALPRAPSPGDAPMTAAPQARRSKSRTDQVLDFIGTWAVPPRVFYRVVLVATAQPETRAAPQRPSISPSHFRAPANPLRDGVRARGNWSATLEDRPLLSLEIPWIGWFGQAPGALLWA